MFVGYMLIAYCLQGDAVFVVCLIIGVWGYLVWVLIVGDSLMGFG